MSEEQFHEIGEEKSKIDVRVSYRIIKLFSDGLYASPNKAVEELVSNAWDAGADHVNVILPADRDSPNAQIVVIDDGCGMDEGGLRQHWLLGDSKKRLTESKPLKGRKPIGRFGIGKLATYVLANRLTHITKVDGRFYSTSMDYRLIDQGAGDATTEQLVKLPLRVLTAEQAQKAVSEWIVGKKKAQQELKLFGKGAAKGWTVAVMSDLKQMAKELSEARLRWILETAMPLGEDFCLYLNGESIVSSKEKSKKIGTWVLGRDLGTAKVPLPRPGSGDFEISKDKKFPASSPNQYGLFHPLLLRVTGFVEAYQDELTGKSDNWGQSNGFFVYVRGRRINIDDPGFGIDRNKLQHGTFSHFRMVVHIDALDEDLRSSRETIRAGEKLNIAQDLLTAGFNYARARIADFFDKAKPGAAMAARVADSPASLTARPIFNILTEALEGRAHPRYIEIPKDLSKKERANLLDAFEHPDEKGFLLVENADLKPLSTQGGIALYDVCTRSLRINTMHPFVAHFLNEFQNSARSLPLELFAISEVLLEANLYQSLKDEKSIQEVLERRDQLLRHLAKTTGKRNAFLIAQGLEEAAYDKSALEREVVNAFISLGFEALPLGGPKKPDGVAEAYLSASNGKERAYRVSLEAKSKERPDTKVSAKAVDTAAIARQRDTHDCDHAIVVGPDFPASAEGKTALEHQLERADGAANNPPKTITLMRVIDLARLVRIQPQKRIGLDKIRELFSSCKMPEESASWVTALESLKVTEPRYRDVLDVIWKLQKEEADSYIDYGKVKTAMRYEKQLEMKEEEIKTICRSMMGMAGGGYIYATEVTVELSQKPEKVLEAIRSVDERPTSAAKKKI